MIKRILAPGAVIFLWADTGGDEAAGHVKPKLVLLMLVLPEYGSGGANLNSPIGGAANGIPRYTETPVELAAG